MNSNTLMEATGCSQAEADIYAPILTKYFNEYGITSIQEQADFLGQVVVETGSLSRFSENTLWSVKGLENQTSFSVKFRAPSPGEENQTVFSDGDYNAVYYANNPKVANVLYAGRFGNGNIDSGDGLKYSGKGLLQTTFEGNYAALQGWTGLDVVSNPNQLLNPDTGVLAAILFWKNYKLGNLPTIEQDVAANNIDAISRAINGNPNAANLALRRTATAKALQALNDPNSFTWTPPAKTERHNSIRAKLLKTSGKDPLVFDLTGSGFGTTIAASTSSVHFDYSNNGFAQATGWATAEQGILVYDPYETGMVAGVGEYQTELLGDGSIVDGFSELQALAGSGVTLLDPTNPLWSQLKLWIGGDGTPGSGTLETLDQAGVTSIGLIPAATSQTPDSAGNTINALSTFTANGTTCGIADYTFSVNTADTWEDDYLPLTAEIEALPEIIASGTVYDLSQAMVRDDTLTALVQQFSGTSSFSDAQSLATQILHEWTGANQITDSEADFMNSRELYTVEQFQGISFSDSDIATLNNSGAGSAAQQISNVYQQIYKYVFGALIAQGQLANLWDGQPFNTINGGQSVNNPDFDLATQFFSDLIATDPGTASNDLALFAQALNGLGLSNAPGYSNFKIQIVSNVPDLGQILSAFDGTGGAPIEMGTDASSQILSGTNTGGFLFGFSGNDYFVSNGGNVLEDFGVGGDDIYNVSSGDTIKDASSLGAVFFNGKLLTGGEWNPLTQQFESPDYIYQVMDPSTLRVVSVADPSQSITIEDDTSQLILGNSSQSTIQLKDGPTQFDYFYVTAFDTISLMVGPQGLGITTADQINAFLTGGNPSYTSRMLQEVLGLSYGASVQDIAAAGVALLNGTRTDQWSAALTTDKRGELLALMGLGDAAVAYSDDSNGIYTQGFQPQGAITSVVFGGQWDTYLSAGLGDDYARLYAGPDTTYMTGEARDGNDYFAQVGETIYDPNLNGTLHLDTNIDPSDVSFSLASGQNLVITIDGPNPGQIVVDDWFSAGPNGVPLAGGVTTGSYTWSQQQITNALLTQYANDTSADSISTLYGHSGFSNTLVAGQGNDTLIGGYGEWTMDASGQWTEAPPPGDHFILGSGVDTVYGGGGPDIIDVTSPTGQATLNNESVSSLLRFGSQFADDMLTVQLVGNNLVINDNEGAVVTINGTQGPAVQMPDGHVYSAADLYQDAYQASQSKSLYAYEYGVTGDAFQFEAFLSNVDPQIAQLANSQLDAAYNTDDFFSVMLSEAQQYGYSVLGTEDGQPSLRYQDGEQIRTYGFNLNVSNPSDSNPYDPHSNFWEQVTFDFWTDKSTGALEYGLTQMYCGYGGQTVYSYDESGKPFDSQVDSVTTYSFSQDPTQVLLQQRNTKFTLFGQS